MRLCAFLLVVSCGGEAVCEPVIRDVTETLDADASDWLSTQIEAFDAMTRDPFCADVVVWPRDPFVDEQGGRITARVKVDDVTNTDVIDVRRAFCEAAMLQRTPSLAGMQEDGFWTSRSTYQALVDEERRTTAESVWVASCMAGPQAYAPLYRARRECAPEVWSPTLDLLEASHFWTPSDRPSWSTIDTLERSMVPLALVRAVFRLHPERVVMTWDEARARQLHVGDETHRLEEFGTSRWVVGVHGRQALISTADDKWWDYSMDHRTVRYLGRAPEGGSSGTSVAEGVQIRSFRTTSSRSWLLYDGELHALGVHHVDETPVAFGSLSQIATGRPWLPHPFDREPSLDVDLSGERILAGWEPVMGSDGAVWSHLRDYPHAVVLRWTPEEEPSFVALCAEDGERFLGLYPDGDAVSAAWATEEGLWLEPLRTP